MGRRCQPRKVVEVGVRIFGTDGDGKIFSAKVVTVNLSRQGAELGGVCAKLGFADIIGLSYGNNRAHFRVKWVGEGSKATSGCLGLVNIAPEKPLWDFPLPPDAVDNYQPTMAEHRKERRYRCQSSVEVHVPGGASFWGTVADLSVGGCYVEIPIPLELGKHLKVGIWLGTAKAWAEARVTHTTPGLGVGMKFTEISQSDLDQIRQFVRNLAPLAT